MKKIFSIFIVLLLIGCATETIPQAKEETEVRLGAILMLTSNDFVDVAKAFQEGIDLAVDEINADGGVLGKQVKVIYEDDQFVSVNSATAAAKLVNVDKIHAGLIGLINTAKAAAPIFNDAKIPLTIVWDAKIRGVGLENLPYLFGPGYSTKGAGEIMANFANKKDIKKVAVIYQADEWSQLISGFFIDEFKGRGGQVVVSEQLSLEETDFKTVILKAKDVDAIYLPFVAHEDIFIKRARELGFKGTLLSGDSTTDQVIANAGKAAEGLFFTQMAEPDTGQFNVFKEAYKKKYGKETSGLIIFTALAYDTTKLVAEAIKRAGSTDGTAIKDAMYGIKDLDGALGTISIDDFGGAAKLEKVFTVKDGKQVLVE